MRGLNGKEHEITKEIKQTKVKYLALTETKKKGQGIEEIEDYILVYSGVSRSERARAGVACLIHSDDKGKIKGWKFINERILTVDIDEGKEK